MNPGQDPGAAFTAIIQLGTEAAVLIYFWSDITRIIGRWFKALAGKVPHSDPDVRMGWLVIIGSIPIGVLGSCSKIRSITPCGTSTSPRSC